jgi:hypothetical protein
VAAKQSVVKKYVVTLNAEGREHLQTVIRSGKRSPRSELPIQGNLAPDSGKVQKWGDWLISGPSFE